MTRPITGRKRIAAVAMMLVTFALGVAGAVVVANPAAASGTSSACPTTSTTSTTSTSATSLGGVDPNSPEAKFFVINGTSGAASDHEIVGSSAFPNYSTGAVDNWYSLAHAHVDNSPFAEGLASPFDTGPIGQTAAAGNTQQPQYADARWPGDTCHAEYGNQGGPYAQADVSDFNATANASEASNSLAVPKGFDSRLQAALATWKLKWAGPLSGNTAKVPSTTVKVPSVTVPTPAKTVSTPTATVTTPSVPLPSLPTAPATPATPVAVPSVASSHSTSQPPRTMASTGSGDGEGLLESSVTSVVDKKTNALVTTGESRVGRVSIGGGQIVLEKIHVTASITNDGTKPTPDYKANVTLGSASIAGYPVTIDEKGVTLVGQNQALPYKQASDALNSALKQAGIQLFLVSPEVTTNTCGSSGGGGSGSGTSTNTTSTTTTSSDQSGFDSTGSCGPPPCQSGMGGGTYPGSSSGTSTTTTTNTTTTSGDQSGMGSSTGCDQSGMGTTCDQSGSGYGNGTTTGSTTTSSTPTPALTTPGTSTTSTNQTSTTPSSTGSCDQGGMPPSTTGCSPKTGTGTSTGTTTTSTDQTSTTPTTSPGSPFDVGSGSGSSGEEIVTATGVHILFTQPVAPSGVPAQNIEHILGEVYLDSLAQPAGPLPSLNGASPSSLSSPYSPSSSTTSSCGKGKGHSSGFKTSGGSASTAGGSSASGGTLGTSATGSSMSGGGGSPSGSTYGSGSSQPTGSSTGNSVPAMFASALKKPLWLLLAYLVWQVLVVGTGASLWHWNKEGS